jgi:hypothetical protein
MKPEEMLDRMRRVGEASWPGRAGCGAADPQFQHLMGYIRTPRANGGPEGPCPPIAELVEAWWAGFHRAADRAAQEGRRINRAIRAVAREDAAAAAAKQPPAPCCLKPCDRANTRGTLFEARNTGTAGTTSWLVQRFSGEMPHLIRFIARTPRGKRLDQIALWSDVRLCFDEENRWAPRPPVVPAWIIEKVTARLREEATGLPPAPAAPAPAPAERPQQMALF